MRRKKHKNVRRTVRFYRINYGFRPPYKVLLDGNFEHALQAMKRGDAKDLLAKLLGDQVKVFTTKCVMHELRSLGAEFAGTRQACKKYALHKCGHDDAHVSAAECLLAQLGDKNPDHFLIATQDRGLQRKAMAVPGGAVVFASVNGVHLESPSAMQKSQVKQVEEEHMSVKPQELQSAALGALAEAQQAQRAAPAFRRKKAKGPNPLSVKPKSKKKDSQQQQAQQQQPKQPAQQQRSGAAKPAAAPAGGQQAPEGGSGKRKRPRRRKKEGGSADGE